MKFWSRNESSDRSETGQNLAGNPGSTRFKTIFRPKKQCKKCSEASYVRLVNFCLVYRRSCPIQEGRIKPWQALSSLIPVDRSTDREAKPRTRSVTKLVELLEHHLCLLSLTQSKAQVYDVDKDPEMIRPLGKPPSASDRVMR